MRRAVSYGWRVFVLVWFGQLVSQLGSGLTEFGLGVWVYQRTGSPLRFALTVLFAALPRIALAPLAGALVDRWDRRWAMILSDAGAALSTLAIGLLFLTGRLAIWHIYLASAVSSAFRTFQGPAYSAATTLLVPKEDYARASGMGQTARSVASLVAPPLAGLLLVWVGLGPVILIDVATFLFAVLTLLAVRFPRPPVSAEGAAARGSLLREMSLGWRYIRARSGLLGLLTVYAALWFIGTATEVLITPYVLSFATPAVLGLIMSATGAGLLVGGLAISACGGPRRLVRGFVVFEMLVGVCTALMGSRPSALLLGVAAFLCFICIAVSDSCSHALWQRKVAPDVQGRVFALRDAITLSIFPLGLLIAAPLAEYVFEPLLMAGGALAGSVGRVIGVGPGRGMGLLLIITGAVHIAVLAAGYLQPRIRHLEDELPDALPDGVGAPAMSPM